MLLNDKIHSLLSRRKKAAETMKSDIQQNVADSELSIEDLDKAIIQEVFGDDQISAEDLEAFKLLSDLVSANSAFQTMSADDDDGTSPKRKVPK
jgi:hypothetical protein